MWRWRFIERFVWRFFRISIRLAWNVAIGRRLRRLKEGH
jgi:hypothetical protein